MPLAAFQTPHGFVYNSRCHCLAVHGHRDSRDLDILILCVLHMLVEVLHHLLLHMLVEGWLRTLLVGAPLALRVVEYTIGRLVHR